MSYVKLLSIIVIAMIIGCGSPDLSSDYSRYEIEDIALSRKIYIITEHRGLSSEQTYITFDSNYCNIDSLNSIAINGAIQGFTYTVKNDTLFVYTKKVIKKYTLSTPPVIVFVDDEYAKANDLQGSKKVDLWKSNSEFLKCPVAK